MIGRIEIDEITLFDFRINVFKITDADAGVLKHPMTCEDIAMLKNVGLFVSAHGRIESP